MVSIFFGEFTLESQQNRDTRNMLMPSIEYRRIVGEIGLQISGLWPGLMIIYGRRLAGPIRLCKYSTIQQ